MAPGKYACSQVCERWGAEEERHYRPGHHWVFELGMAADGTCIEKSFELPRRSFEVYKGVRFYDGEHAIVVKVWLHRTPAAHGLEFAEWHPTAEDLDPDAPPAELIVNSSELRGVCSVGSQPCSELQKVLPPAFQRPGATWTRGAAVLEAEGAGDATFVLRSDIDNAWRERCE